MLDPCWAFDITQGASAIQFSRSTPHARITSKLRARPGWHPWSGRLTFNGVEGHPGEETVCLWACRHRLPVMCKAQEPDDGTLWMLKTHA